MIILESDATGPNHADLETAARQGLDGRKLLERVVGNIEVWWFWNVAAGGVEMTG